MNYLLVFVILPLEEGLPILRILLVVCSFVHPDLLAVGLQEVFRNLFQIVLWVFKRLSDVLLTAVFLHDLKELFFKLFLKLELHEDVDVVDSRVNVAIADELEGRGGPTVIRMSVDLWVTVVFVDLVC
jgi:hypothetical protein